MMEIFHSLFQFCCHQHPERSAVYDGVVFPLCFRCSGIFMGIFSSYLILLIGKFSPTHFNRKDIIPLILFLLPLSLDGVANGFLGWQSPALMRSLTGLFFGVPLPFLLNYLFHHPRNQVADQDGNPFAQGITRAVMPAALLLLMLGYPSSPASFMFVAFCCASGFFGFLIHLILSNPWFRLSGKNGFILPLRYPIK